MVETCYNNIYIYKKEKRKKKKEKVQYPIKVQIEKCIDYNSVTVYIVIYKKNKILTIDGRN